MRELRLRRGLVIEDLARKSGLSKPYISQVETGKASPSLGTVQKLAQALGVPLTYLFLEEAFGCHVTRRAERRAVSFGDPDKLVYFLSAPNRSLEMLLLEIPSGYTAGGRTHSHEGEECHWVLEGTITAVQGDQRFVLARGRQLPLGRQRAPSDREPRPRGRPAARCQDAAGLFERDLLRGTSRPAGDER